MMTLSRVRDATLRHLDEPTRLLVRVSAALAGGTEDVVRRELGAAVDVTPVDWMEELLLQTYLFAGFPRALNGMREWRRLQPLEPANDAPRRDVVRAGEHTCAAVYGDMYHRLRENVRALHPSLDEWMITEGYGKVLSRPGLDLPRRELCIVAACAATSQDRQLQSHLHGARNVGASDAAITDTLSALRGIVGDEHLSRAVRLWARISA
jgi:4-carboxymuconolactone decarboxylase